MKVRILTTKMLIDFQKYFVSQEKSKATTEKYLRDAKAFADFAGGGEVTKEIVIAYKEHLRGNYAVRSVNSIRIYSNLFIRITIFKFVILLKFFYLSLLKKYF